MTDFTFATSLCSFHADIILDGLRIEYEVLSSIFEHYAKGYKDPTEARSTSRPSTTPPKSHLRFTPMGRMGLKGFLRLAKESGLEPEQDADGDGNPDPNRFDVEQISRLFAVQSGARGNGAIELKNDEKRDGLNVGLGGFINAMVHLAFARENPRFYLGKDVGFVGDSSVREPDVPLLVCLQDLAEVYLPRLTEKIKQAEERAALKARKAKEKAKEQAREQAKQKAEAAALVNKLQPVDAVSPESTSRSARSARSARAASPESKALAVVIDDYAKTPVFERLVRKDVPLSKDALLSSRKPAESAEPTVTQPEAPTVPPLSFLGWGWASADTADAGQYTPAPKASAKKSSPSKTSSRDRFQFSPIPRRPVPLTNTPQPAPDGTSLEWRANKSVNRSQRDAPWRAGSTSPKGIAGCCIGASPYASRPADAGVSSARSGEATSRPPSTRRSGPNLWSFSSNLLPSERVNVLRQSIDPLRIPLINSARKRLSGAPKRDYGAPPKWSYMASGEASAYKVEERPRRSQASRTRELAMSRAVANASKFQERNPEIATSSWLLTDVESPLATGRSASGSPSASPSRTVSPPRRTVSPSNQDHADIRPLALQAHPSWGAGANWGGRSTGRSNFEDIRQEASQRGTKQRSIMEGGSATDLV